MIAAFTGIYFFLSNFYGARIKLGGLVYPTAEHAYQAAKFTDTGIRRHIQSLSTAAQAKGFAKKLQNANSPKIRSDWDSVRLEVMIAIVTQKFTYHAELGEKLLATGEQEIVEGNYWGDRFWGQYQGVGENHLGIILMQVRKNLQDAQKPAPKPAPKKARAPRKSKTLDIALDLSGMGEITYDGPMDF